MVKIHSNALSGHELNFKNDQVPRSRTRLRLANFCAPFRAKTPSKPEHKNSFHRKQRRTKRSTSKKRRTYLGAPFRSKNRYQATFSFSTYIYRIAHNLAISELRQRKRRRLVPLPSFFSDKDSEEIEVEIEDKRQVMADDAMIASERQAAVRRAITSLPEKYRAALVLCDIEEKSYEEISEVLDLPVGTVKSRINRARNLLKDKLREYL